MQNPEQSEQPNAPTDFPAYPAYKPSGVEWLGDIPAHWEVRRLKYLARNISQPTSERVEGELRLGLEHVESWTGKYEIAENVRFESKMKRFQPDDVLFGKLRPYLAKVTRPDRAGLCMGDFLVFRSKSNIMVAGFLEYLLRCKYVIDLIDSSAVGAKMPRADWNFIGNVWLPLPPLPEQRAIAAYLDRKGAIARRYAHVARHIIDTLRELRQVEIHDAVTRGLNEDAPLKPSGVEWLRDVPEHWDVCQVKRKYAIKLGKMLQNYPKRETDIAVPYLKVPNVQWAGVSAADAQTMYASPRDVEQYSIRKGDLLVCEGGEGGRCAILEEEPPPNCIIQNALHRVRPLRDDSNAYLKYTMNAIDTMGWFDAINNKATIAHFTVEKFSTLFIPNPPIAEQRAIAEYLDAKTAAIDAAIAHYERMAELVAEYWTVLVADAVTGRIDLRQEAAPQPE